MILHGFLTKKNSRGMWKARYVVLSHDALTTYKPNSKRSIDQKAAEIKELIMIKAIVNLVVLSSNGLELEIVMSAGSNLTFRGETKDEIEDWVSALKARVVEIATTTSAIASNFEGEGKGEKGEGGKHNGSKDSGNSGDEQPTNYLGGAAASLPKEIGDVFVNISGWLAKQSHRKYRVAQVCVCV